MSPIKYVKSEQIDFRKDPLTFKADKHDLVKGMGGPCLPASWHSLTTPNGYDFLAPFSPA